MGKLQNKVSLNSIYALFSSKKKLNINQIHLIEKNNGLFSENIQWAQKTLDFFYCFWKNSYACQGCIYLISKNNIVKYYN